MPTRPWLSRAEIILLTHQPLVPLSLLQPPRSGWKGIPRFTASYLEVHAPRSTKVAQKPEIRVIQTGPSDLTPNHR
ncbi:hypothetical protein LshimejAT787_1303520 [Lyophyllum shimeji]|uniref:Uncharacterized protein n=1 Tax=Lyophyllum shimeji TaxID=47721 RepID=A0A9P3UUS8_LYOSH|nr:hypothetical protein LshimejAT787_1303520 [Lyophyllum shimeji]